MAITAYIGVPGSGKSYEVVKSVIIPALLKGRRVVTNIYGLKINDIYEYCKSKNKKANIGELINVTNDQCKDAEFLPYKDAVNTFCKPGDLICLDEVWRFWNSDSDIHPNHRSFVAEHRHFADEKTGVTCDLVVINQAIVNIPRFIKDRIESTFKMTKLKTLGLNNRYRVDIFTGTKTFKNNMSSQLFSKYEKKIFSLYSSYESENATEVNVDSRGVIFKSPAFIAGAIIFVLCLYLSISSLVSIFSSKDKKQDVVTTSKVESEKGKPVSNSAIPSFTPSPQKPPVLSKTWRIKGSYKTSAGAFVILSSVAGVTRIEPMSNFSFSGSLMSGVIDNELVTTYSGDSSK